ncbi:MAG: exosortase/archaeosortase family protein [Candidatus Micrarchaeaceae archaeon]
MIYSVFASPFLLLPLLNLNAGFANVNANIIYNFVRALGVNASKVGLVITSASGSSITISTTCVSLGTFIAFVMFLIPLAYLYDGKLKNKIYWIFSGIVLIVALNLLRMLSITLVWVYYGINSAASLFHTFAGQIIFYAAIIIMVLLYYKYGLAIGKSKKSILKDIKTFKFTDKDIFITCLVVVFLAIIAFGFSYNYSNAVIVPSTLLKSNLQISQIPVYQYVLSNMENSRSNVIVIENTPGGALFSLGASNLTSNQSIFALVNYTHQLSNSYNVLSYNSSAKHHYLLRNGITLTAQTAYSGNYLFDVNYFSAPYELNSTSATIVDYVLFREQNSSAIYCNAFNYSSDAPEYIESYIYNLIDSGNYNNKGLICQSYLIASSIK